MAAAGSRIKFLLKRSAVMQQTVKNIIPFPSLLMTNDQQSKTTTNDDNNRIRGKSQKKTKW
jgi:hypothetical protein